MLTVLGTAARWFMLSPIPLYLAVGWPRGGRGWRDPGRQTSSATTGSDDRWCCCCSRWVWSSPSASSPPACAAICPRRVDLASTRSRRDRRLAAGRRRRRHPVRPGSLTSLVGVTARRSTTCAGSVTGDTAVLSILRLRICDGGHLPLRRCSRCGSWGGTPCSMGIAVSVLVLARGLLLRGHLVAGWS